MENKSDNTFLRVILILGGGIVLGFVLFLTVLFLYQRSYAGKIYRGISVNDVTLGGLTADEAAEKLRTEIRYSSEDPFRFTYEGRTWQAFPQELGFQLRADEMAEKALRIGRDGSLIENISEQIGALLYGRSVDVVYLFDGRVAFNFITHMAEEIDQPMGQPAITLQGSQVIIQPGTEGRLLNRAMTMSLLQAYAEKLQSAEIELPVAVLAPTEANLGKQKDVLEFLLSQDFVLYTNDERGTLPAGTIPADVLAGMIDFAPVISDSEVTITMTPKWEPFYSRLVEIGNNVYREARNARFAYNEYTRSFTLIEEASTGKQIDVEASLANITDSIRAGHNQAEVVLTVEEPLIKGNETPEELGIRELVHTENTYFFYSDAERIQNIKVGAGKLNGVLIAPAQTFSMADAVGEVSKETGFAESSVIFGDATIQDVGGGLCQVSTTLFRAAFNYGLPINERHAHGYRVYYYERLGDKTLDPGLAGTDAAVYLPTLDLKFTNDTPYWILMMTDVNTELCRLQWKFYSTNVNRYVTWESSGLTNVIPQGEPKYNENPDLPAGTVKQVDWGIDGADVTITRTVMQDGYIHINDKIETHYEAWNDIFEYGPGTTGIPGIEEEDEE